MVYSLRPRDSLDIIFQLVGLGLSNLREAYDIPPIII